MVDEPSSIGHCPHHFKFTSLRVTSNPKIFREVGAIFAQSLVIGMVPCKDNVFWCQLRMLPVNPFVDYQLAQLSSQSLDSFVLLYSTTKLGSADASDLLLDSALFTACLERQWV